jgi:hypothetical protein
MTRTLRISTVWLFVALLAVSSFGQDRPGWQTASDIGEGSRGSAAGTVVDVDEGRNRLQLELDADGSRVNVETDAITTQYNGFGGMIAGKPEIFVGSKGFSNVRVGDRLEVRGVGRGRGAIVADTVRLVGRSVAAAPTGVGDTRPRTNVATPVDDQTTGTTTQTGGTVEGTIRQINADNGRIVIQTPQRQMITIRTARNTPVWYRGTQYRITNLEVGDRIRIEAEARDAQYDDISARRIDVLQSVQDTPTGNSPIGGTVTLLSGRITRVEPGLDYAYLDTGRGTETRVDMGNANDALGDRIRAGDLRVNDRVEISGNYNRTGDMFVASTVRYSSSGGVEPNYPPRPEVDEIVRYSVVTITGTVTETLEDGATLGIRDRDTNRILRVWVTEDFVIRLKSNTAYSVAERLQVNDGVVIKAFRDADGNLIAQTIRVRTR